MRPPPLSKQTGPPVGLIHLIDPHENREMKIVTDKVAESILGAIAILSICAILSTLPVFISPRELHLGEVPHAATWVILFPFLLLFRLYPAIDHWQAFIPVIAIVCFLLSLAFWTGAIHGLRLLIARRQQ